MEEIVADIFSRLPEHLSESYRKNFDCGLDVDCAFNAQSGERIRVNLYKSENGISAAVRIIPNKIMLPEEIGLPSAIVKICSSNSGLFIVSGANGVGKTTSIASIIDAINDRRDAHILTIEDPVEYLFKSRRALITQREIGIHAKSFYEALRSAVRENPDIIVLGEMRDLETTRTAIELAETGHLVLATLHTRSATSAIDRLIGQFSASEQSQIRMMISENLLGVLTQTLLPRIGGGLVAAFELLINTSSIKNLIREQKIPQIYTFIQTGRQEGMVTIEDSLLQLVKRGIIDPKNAILKSNFPEALSKSIANLQR